ncbi:MAG: lactate utilization protein C [Nocardioides sp.]|nr:lactate utilization protein C [Nocardioides sp.]
MTSTSAGNDARAEILGRVRSALRAVEPTPEPVLAPTTARTLGDAAAVDLFDERVADYRAVVERCTAGDLAARVGAALARHDATRAVVVPPGLAAALGVEESALAAAVPGAVADHDPGTGAHLTPYDLDRADAVVTAATLGIAETGTIVLDHGPGQGRRALTLVPDVHVCVVRTDQVVRDVPDAVTRLDPNRPLTWISGPSATSDIELDRVEGVHGPRTLHVLLVG